MASAQNYTVEDLSQDLPFSEATIRRHALEWGARKLPGSRKWLFSAATRERLIELHGRQVA